LEKTVDPWNWAVSSSVVGRGYLSGMMALFAALKPTQILSPPDLFFTTTRLEIQGNALLDDVAIKRAL